MFKKIIKRLLIISAGIIILILISSLLIAYIYEDKVKDFIVSRLNKNLNTEISLKDIRFSILHKFPYASLTFYDVIAKDATEEKKDTLLAAKKIFLQFNVWDIIDKNYRIKRIEIADAKIKMTVYNEKNDNFHFWKNPTEFDTSGFSFDLRKVVFSNIEFIYKNQAISHLYHINIKKCNLSGKILETENEISTDGDFYINLIKAETMTLVEKEYLKINLNVKYISNKNLIFINEGDVFLGKLNFSIEGNIIYNELKKYIDLKIKGKNIDLEKVFSNLPKEYKKYTQPYETSGEINFSATVKGDFGSNRFPNINAYFNLKKGEITHKENSISFKSISFSGTYSNGNNHNLTTSTLKINNFYTTLENGIIKATVYVDNFVKPSISLSFSANLDLEKLNSIVKIDKIDVLSGNINISAIYKGTLDNIKSLSYNDFTNSNTTGNISLNDVNLKLKNENQLFSNIFAELKFDKCDIIIDKLKGYIGKSDFKLHGFLKNILPFIFIKDEKLYVEADLNSSLIELDKLIKNNAKKDSLEYYLNFSDKISLNLDLNLSKLTFEKFEAENITGKLKLIDKQFLAKDLLINSMKGAISLTGMIDGTINDKFLISFESNLKKLDIRELFYELNSFNQNYVTNENINGEVSANVQFAATCSNSLKFDLDKLYAKADLNIVNGQLKDIKTLKGLSKFVKLEDLSNIKFENMNNSIEIKNQKIIIPEMELKSNALNLKFSGEHTFNNEIDYRAQILLSDLLWRKAKTANKTNEEFGIVEQDDGVGKTTLFVKITGTVDKPKFSYDTKAVKQKISKGIKEEKQNLKSILHQEFGWFKKDSVKLKEYNNKKIKKDEGKFIIEWEESDSTKNTDN